jgi:flagellar basal body-associated protein FliL
MQKGFITLIGLLIIVLLIGVWFVRMYSSSGTKEAEKETYQQSVKKAEDIKKLLEAKQY